MSEGPLYLIGGHEAPQGNVLNSFAEAVGGRGPVALVTAATVDPGAAYRHYRESFIGMGVSEVVEVAVAERADAGRAELVRTVGEAGGVFFTGGDQLRITSLVGGTPLEQALRSAWLRGTPLGGTSAGASVMSATMVVGGEDEATARLETIRMCPGLGYLRDAVVDQHFAQRGRINRLLAALAEHPGVLGIGIDEDTAIRVDPDGTLAVVGSRTVTVLDARGAELTNASDTGEADPLTLGPVRLYVLSAGHGYQLWDRCLLHAPVSRGNTSAVRLLR